jgi:hypothetical protein
MKERFEKYIYVYTSKIEKDNTRLKLRLTAEEAYNFCHLRQVLLDTPKHLEKPFVNPNIIEYNEFTGDELTLDQRKERLAESLKNELGQINNPVDIIEMGLDATAIRIVGKLMNDDHQKVSSLSKETIAKCDLVVEKLRLDKNRGKYFSVSRFNNQESRKDVIQSHKLYEDKNYYFDDNWTKIANLDQNKFKTIVLHPYLKEYKTHLADYKWVQVIYEFKVPDDVIAIKSFALKLESYRAIISLNIIKPMYQVGYVISREYQTDI